MESQGVSDRIKLRDGETYNRADPMRTRCDVSDDSNMGEMDGLTGTRDRKSHRKTGRWGNIPSRMKTTRTTHGGEYADAMAGQGRNNIVWGRRGSRTNRARNCEADASSSDVATSIDESSESPIRREGEGE